MSRRAAAWLAIGDELVDGVVREGNGDWLAARMSERGWSLASRLLLRDDPTAISSALVAALEAPGDVVICGGFGPTPDDRTLQALAGALGEPLVEDSAQLARLRAWASERGIEWHPGLERQCLRPRSAEAIDNPSGSAPALRGMTGRGRWLALPGVPHEFRGCWNAAGDPWWPRAERRRAAGVYRFSGIGESTVANAIGDRFDRDGWETTILSGAGEVTLRVAGRAFDESGRLELESALRKALGDAWYGTAEDSLAGAVAARFSAAGRTLAIAESCTGGGLGAELTGVPGASDWFLGGHLVYSNALKHTLSGVGTDVLKQEGAVSRSTALALARGVRERCGSDEGFSVTGIAGPGGGSEARPIGTVWFAWTGPEGERAWTRRFPGGRASVRARSIAFALDRLRRLPAGAPADDRL